MDIESFLYSYIICNHLQYQNSIYIRVDTLNDIFWVMWAFKRGVESGEIEEVEGIKIIVQKMGVGL